MAQRIYPTTSLSSYERNDNFSYLMTEAFEKDRNDELFHTADDHENDEDEDTIIDPLTGLAFDEEDEDYEDTEDEDEDEDEDEEDDDNHEEDLVESGYIEIDEDDEDDADKVI